MIAAIIMIIVGVIVFVISASEKQFGESMIGLILVILAFGSIQIDAKLEDKKKLEYNISYPEEMYLIQPNDTLYVTKRTKDSIYLEFRNKK